MTVIDYATEIPEATIPPAKRVVFTQVSAWGPEGNALFCENVPTTIDALALLREKNWTELQVIVAGATAHMVLVEDKHSGCTAMIHEFVR